MNVCVCVYIRHVNKSVFTFIYVRKNPKIM